MSDYFRQNGANTTFLSTESWVILCDIEQAIKTKIEAIGTPLKDWNISINYGVKTGYNEAFIIDGKKKEELIVEDPKSAEIIRPLLRGRDIKRYSYEFADLYIITTFPSLKINIDDYPAVKQHLMSFGYDRLKQTGDGGARKKTNNQWFETQDSINYWEDFYKQKIIWGEISDSPKFSIELEGKYINEATTFLMVGESLLYLISFLNSKISEYFFSKIGTTTGVGTVRWKKFTIEQLFVPKICPSLQKQFEDITIQIINNTKNNKDSSSLFKQINSLTYELFEFSAEEIELIENN
ncbi:TaqI-like C-terminal specificity domain-containing protein [Chryseobacterium sp. WLY505]|uniref:TaqI-like C-terminal specificity domain-containing protein n=1 Tax=Chryseobacterium sp. WLY505 TaxID=3068892 RepID=UPI00279681D2|nr:TaqI-like C-terminal specificity domain-containing protein [Chryseobacterium sp. WLY505]MDQ1854905.1 TaqI-like C-terminal specificity domain-containing protein [Chryseobacterium sp. WLY505]